MIMDELDKSTFEYCLNNWVKHSLLFKDPERWFEELKRELAEIEGLEGEIKALSLETDLRLQSLLLDAGFNTDEIFELMRLPSTAIDIIDADGGVIEWKQQRQSYRR
jgi:hypothetical protein